jgi:undecaprenyl-diphosphatase
VEAPPEPVTPTRRGPALVGGLVALGVFVLLGIGVATRFLPQMQLDTTVSRALYSGDQRGPGVNLLLEVLTAPGLAVSRFVVYLPVVLLLLRARAWWSATWVLTAVVLIGPVNSAFKLLFGRVRPDFAEGGARYTSLSYPSGHSSGIATLATVAVILAWPYLVRRHLRAIVLVAAVVAVAVVGLTRMWLGVHFLTDVLGGWSLGIAWSLLTAVAFSALPGGRAALPGPRVAVSGPP